MVTDTPPRESHPPVATGAGSPQIVVEVQNKGQGDVVVTVGQGPTAKTVDLVAGGTYTVSVGDAGFSVGPRK